MVTENILDLHAKNPSIRGVFEVLVEWSTYHTAFLSGLPTLRFTTR